MGIGTGYGVHEVFKGNMKKIAIIGLMDNTIDHTFESANRVYSSKHVCPTIPTCGGGSIQPKVIRRFDYGRRDKNVLSDM
jgi:hypothetical protein